MSSASAPLRRPPRGRRPRHPDPALRASPCACLLAAGLSFAWLAFASWLEEAAIPSRVIDELMGHASGRRDRGVGGSTMGRVYRETTPAMVARVTAALDDRIGHALAVAAYLLREGRDSGAVDGREGL